MRRVEDILDEFLHDEVALKVAYTELTGLMFESIFLTEESLVTKMRKALEEEVSAHVGWVSAIEKYVLWKIAKKYYEDA